MVNHNEGMPYHDAAAILTGEIDRLQTQRDNAVTVLFYLECHARDALKSTMPYHAEIRQRMMEITPLFKELGLTMESFKG